MVDVEFARKCNITVCNIPAYGTSSVAQMVFAHILNHTQRVALHADSVKNGNWSNSTDFCYWNSPLIELKNKTLGLIGYGKIGKETAKIALAFGMQVLAYDLYVPKEIENQVKFSGLDDLLTKSDFVSLHCPLTPETNQFIDAVKITKMKSSAFLINTSRGALINEHALADALNNEMIAGSGLDVLSIEPPMPDNPLLKAKNCFITPHISWATIEARTRLMGIAAENIKMFLNGNERNVIN